MTHHNTQSHVHSHTLNPKKSEDNGFCQFNLCFGTLMWDLNRWQLQHGCSASLGCVGVIVSRSCLLTCCNLHCLKHCGTLSRKPIVDLMQSHGESRIIIISCVRQSSATCSLLEGRQNLQEWMPLNDQSMNVIWFIWFYIITNWITLGKTSTLKPFNRKN